MHNACISMYICTNTPQQQGWCTAMLHSGYVVYSTASFQIDCMSFTMNIYALPHAWSDMMRLPCTLVFVWWSINKWLSTQINCHANS